MRACGQKLVKFCTHAAKLVVEILTFYVHLVGTSLYFFHVLLLSSS